MTASNSELTIRACAFEIIRLCEEHAQDNAAQRQRNMGGPSPRATRQRKNPKQTQTHVKTTRIHTHNNAHKQDARHAHDAIARTPHATHTQQQRA